MASKKANSASRRHAKVYRRDTTTAESKPTPSSSSSPSGAAVVSTGTPSPSAASSALTSESIPLFSSSPSPILATSSSIANSGPPVAPEETDTAKHSSSFGSASLSNIKVTLVTRSPDKPANPTTETSSNPAPLEDDPPGMVTDLTVTTDSVTPRTSNSQSLVAPPATSSGIGSYSTAPPSSSSPQQSSSTVVDTKSSTGPAAQTIYNQPTTTSLVAHTSTLSGYLSNTKALLTTVAVAAAETSTSSAASSQSGLLLAEPGVFVPISSASSSPILISNSLTSTSTSQSSLDESRLATGTLPFTTSKASGLRESVTVASSTTSLQPLENPRASAISTHSAIHGSGRNSTAETNSGAGSGQIIAISVGTICGIVGLIFLAVLLTFCLKWRRRNHSDEDVYPTYSERRFPVTTTFQTRLRSLANAPTAIASKWQRGMHSRGMSSTGLMSNRQMTTSSSAGVPFRPRRSYSEPSEGFPVLSQASTPVTKQRNWPSPIATKERPRTRSGVSASPGPMQQYQMPWQDSPGPMVVPKTLRVVNPATTDATPTVVPLGADSIAANASYFGIQPPVRAAMPNAVASHRRSLSLQHQIFSGSFIPHAYTSDTTRQSQSIQNMEPMVAPEPHVRNFSRNRISTQPSWDRSVGSETRDAGNTELTAQRVLKSSKTAWEPAQRSSVSHQFLDYSHTSASGSTKTTIGLFGEAQQHPDDVFTLDDGQSTLVSSGEPARAVSTDPDHESCNKSPSPRVSRRLFPSAMHARHISYDPFNYNDPPQTPQSAFASPSPPDSTRSSQIAPTEGGLTFSLNPELLLDIGEPRTNMSENTQYPSSYLTPSSISTQQGSRMSSDPFDLDRPEVLGYTPNAMVTRFADVRFSRSVERSDSSASRGSVTGKLKNRRRSSFQEWKYIDVIRGSAPDQS